MGAEMERPDRPLSGWLRHAGALSTPQFGQTALVILLVTAAYSLYLAGMDYATLMHVDGKVYIYPFDVPLGVPERRAYITFLSFLPFEVLHHPALFWTFVSGFGVCAAIWAMRRFCRWIGVLTVFFYTATLSVFWEHAAAIAEWWNCMAIILMLFAGWYFFFGHEIEAASRNGTFWQTPLFPQWVHDLSVFTLAWFFFMTGVMKLTTSGLGWVDGTVLQLSIHKFRIEWSQPTHLVHDLLLGDRRLASFASASVLLFETGAILAVLPIAFPRLWPVRAVIGFAAAGFLVGVFLLFGRWNFESMLVLVIVFLWPLDRWIAARSSV